MRIISLMLAVAGLFTAAGAHAQDIATTPAKAPAPDSENILHLDLSTGGRVTIQLYPKLAPNHVERIRTLTRQGFYDGIVFHRVIEGFMAQTGDPTGTGSGGSELPDLEAEFNSYPHLRGTVSMARMQQEDSANSQFFIVFQPTFKLDRKYTNFGRVIAGMQYVDRIARGQPPLAPSRILQASIGTDRKPPPDFRMAQNAAAPEREIGVDELNAPLE